MPFVLRPLSKLGTQSAIPLWAVTPVTRGPWRGEGGPFLGLVFSQCLAVCKDWTNSELIRHGGDGRVLLPFSQMYAVFILWPVPAENCIFNFLDGMSVYRPSGQKRKNTFFF